MAPTEAVVEIMAIEMNATVMKILRVGMKVVVVVINASVRYNIGIYDSTVLGIFIYEVMSFGSMVRCPL